MSSLSFCNTMAVLKNNCIGGALKKELSVSTARMIPYTCFSTVAGDMKSDKSEG